MRVIVDRDSCDSTGLCTAIAPDVFELDDDDQLHVRAASVDAAGAAAVEEAARACPKLAIELREDR